MKARCGLGPVLSVALAAVTLAACSEMTVTGEPDREELLDRAIEELVAMPGGPPSAIVVIQRGSDRSVHAAGVSEVGSEAAPDVEDAMRIASVSKAFNGATALSLVDDGVLSLDDTIAERLPELPAAWGAVTLRQLLNHTSGVPDFGSSDDYEEAFIGSLEEAPAPPELLAFLADEPLVFRPGTQYEYSNSDNVVVALMIETATGQDYADVLAAEVLEPLELEDTSLPSGTELPEPFIHGYEIGDDGQPEDISTRVAAGWAWASGGIVSTPADLHAFIRGYVDGELFGDDVRGKQQALFIPAGESDPLGPGENSATVGLFRYQTECGTVFGHTGNFFGYTQFVAASPDGSRSITVSITLRRTQISDGQPAAVFDALLRAEVAAICFAME